jgi:hypothetical protein
MRRPLLRLFFRAICGLKVGDKLLVRYLDMLQTLREPFGLAIPAFFSAV